MRRMVTTAPGVVRRPADLLHLATAAVEAAGRVINAARTSGRATVAESKGRGDWVTSVDREAEAAATSILRMATPEIPILAEEAGGIRSERFWVVDPLDGTTNFVLGFPMVGVSIALVEGGQPVVGVVGAPEIGARWSAVRGRVPSTAPATGWIWARHPPPGSPPPASPSVTPNGSRATCR